MLIWGGVAFGLGILLFVFEYSVRSRKKGGLNPTDRQQLGGLFGFSFVMAGIVMLLVWLAR